MFKSLLQIVAALLPGIVKKRARAEKAAIANETRSADAKAINTRLGRLLILPLFLLGGCAGAPSAVYVNEPLCAIPMEHEGIAGWWLPPALMTALLFKLENCSCQ